MRRGSPRIAPLMNESLSLHDDAGPSTAKGDRCYRGAIRHPRCEVALPSGLELGGWTNSTFPPSLPTDASSPHNAFKPTPTTRIGTSAIIPPSGNRAHRAALHCRRPRRVGGY